MSKHTPGPWHVRYDEHCDLYHVQSPSPPAEGPDVASFCTLADARLIAAAPDLLEALQTLLGDYRDLLQDYSEEREKDGWDAIAEDDAPAIAKARAAIARATGQEVHG
ncbi:MAG TPA: hypothetical protein VIK75_10220 [Calditerricola sp.]